MKNLRNVVNGASVDASTDAKSAILNPSTGAVYASADVEAAYAAASAAFEDWRDTTPGERQKLVLQIADIFEAHADELVEIESENTGKPIAVTMTEEIPPMIDQIRFFAGAARVLEGKSAGEYMKGMTSMIRREPIGVIGQVTPWNYPMMMACWKFIPAIAAGNTVVLKPSDTTPMSTIRMAELLADVLPAGVLNVVTGDRDTGRLVVEHPAASMVSVTGSVRAGMEVAGAAARDLKRVHLELGGKAPIVVFNDADVAAAAEWLAIAGFFNAGQDCTAATRIIVQAGVYEDFVAAIAEQASSTKTTLAGGRAGDGFVPPVNNAAQLSKVLGFLERTPDHARVVAGGGRQSSEGYYIEPTVIADLLQHDEMIQDEIFGPVITVQKFAEEADAIAMANGVRYGLASSVWSKDFGTAMRMAKHLDFGTV